MSALEQLGAALSWSSFSKAETLKKRIWFTLGVLIVYRLGTYIPLAGINPQAMAELTRHHGSGILGMLDMFSGGALGRMTIMSLNLMPCMWRRRSACPRGGPTFPIENTWRAGPTGWRKGTMYNVYRMDKTNG